MISVCIPTFNMGRFVGKAIESVLAQSVQDFEVIVCDNRSTDDTARVVEGYRDPRIRYMLNEQNLGMYGNFNRAVSYATGMFVKPLCADDRIDRHYFEEALNLFTRFPRVGIVTALHLWIDESGREVARLAGDGRKDSLVVAGCTMHNRAPWRHNEMGTPSHVIVRREVFDRVGAFDPAYQHGNDWEMWLRIFRQYDAGFLPQHLVLIGYHEQQASQRADATLISARDTVRLGRAHYGHDWSRRQVLMVRSGEIYFWAAVRRVLEGRRSEAVELLQVATSNCSRIVLAIYVVLHFPAWCVRGVRRQYSRLTGTVWKT